MQITELNASVINHTQASLATGCNCTVDLLLLTFLDAPTFCDNGTELCLAAALSTRGRRVMATDDRVMLDFIVLSLTPYSLPAACSNYTLQANVPVEYTPGMSKRALAATLLALRVSTPAADPIVMIAIIAALAVVAMVGSIVWCVRRKRQQEQRTLEGIRIEPEHLMKHE
jgi:hypothetical protein